MSKIQVRRGTTAEWTASNPVLTSGEIGLDTTTGLIKIGNGSTAWNSLVAGFAPGSSAIPTAWTAPSYAAGWRDYQSTSVFVNVGYRKIGDLVYVRGLLEGQAGLATTVWTFPAGFRPPEQVLTAVYCSAGTMRRIDITPAGAFNISGPAAGEWFALDNMPPFSVTA